MVPVVTFLHVRRSLCATLCALQLIVFSAVCIGGMCARIIHIPVEPGPISGIAELNIFVAAASMVVTVILAALLSPWHGKDCKWIDVFASLRFKEDIIQLAQKLVEALLPYRVRLHIVDPVGQIDGSVFERMEKCKRIIVFGCKRYAENTHNTAATFNEIMYYRNTLQKPPYNRPEPVLLRLCSRFNHRDTRVLFGRNQMQMSWTRGRKNVPEEVLEDILYQLGRPCHMPRCPRAHGHHDACLCKASSRLLRMRNQKCASQGGLKRVRKYGKRSHGKHGRFVKCRAVKHRP